MHYDPIKELLGRQFNRHPLLRRLFYTLLNILLLRSWHVRKALRRLGKIIRITSYNVCYTKLLRTIFLAIEICQVSTYQIKMHIPIL